MSVEATKDHLEDFDREMHMDFGGVLYLAECPDFPVNAYDT